MLRTEYLTSSYSCSRNVLDGEIDKDLMEVIPSQSPWVRIICEKIVHCRRIMSDKNRSFKSVRSTFSNFPGCELVERLGLHKKVWSTEYSVYALEITSWIFGLSTSGWYRVHYLKEGPNTNAKEGDTGAGGRRRNF